MSLIEDCRRTWIAAACLGSLACGTAWAAPDMDAAMAVRVDEVATEWLSSTGAPSVSIAIVQHGALVYAKAFGEAAVLPPRVATPISRYALDSVSKEFTATAVLILAEQGKLSLDDPLSTWFADLGPASAATLRQVLTHTSGLRDYWPQDFLPPEMKRATTPIALIQQWATRPLDFEPGSEWQYSNTGYVLAATVVERVSGEKYAEFLRHHIFAPLGMAQAGDLSLPAGAEDAAGYTRFGLGPVHAAPKEGAGWLFGAASLVMAPGDVARWDIGLIDRTLLRPASYDAQFSPAVLKNGTATSYGLGLDIQHIDGRLRVGHSGAGSGFLAENRLWPAERAAIVVLTNNDWASPAVLADRLAFLVLPSSPPTTRARAVFESLQRGSIDRSGFTEVGNSYFSEAVLDDLHASLEPVGPLRRIELLQESKRGGFVTRRWKILCARARFEAVERSLPDGKLEQFLITPWQD